MIYPRLKLARNLLTDDGIVAISCDDREISHLKQICDEIFGAGNFIATLCHKARASVSNDKIISSSHNFILLYSKNFGVIHNKRNAVGLNPDITSFDKRDEHGEYKIVPVSGPGGAKKGNPYYSFLGVEGYWRYSKDTMESLYNEGMIIRSKNSLGRKYYKSEALKGRRTDTTWWENAGFTSEATKSLKSMMGAQVFDNPKPVSMVMRLLENFTTSTPSAIILDFFAGSGTTAHATLLANARDGGTRRCISIQLPEPIKNGESAREAGYHKISEVTCERIRRAGKKVLEEEAGSLKGRTEPLDVGFRSYRLVDTNFTQWNLTSEITPEVIVQEISYRADSSDDNASSERKLTELLLKLGFSLTEKIQRKSISGLEVFSVADGLVLAYTDEHTTPVMEQLRDLVAARPEKLIIVEDAFHGNDELKTNLAQECLTHHVDLYTA